MKKLLIFIGILALSLSAFGQYTGDKLPLGLTKSAVLAGMDVLVVQKDGESYVKGIYAYKAYNYYKKMLDSIVNLSISGDLSVGDATTLNGSLAVIGSSNFGQSANFYGTIGANNKVYFTDSVYMFDKTYLPSYGYAMVLDTSDNIVKLAPMGGGSAQKVLNDKVAYVNYDLPTNDASLLLFKSYNDAITHILINEEPDSENRWTVKLPSGLCAERVTVYEYVAIDGNANTWIDTLDSYVDFTGIDTSSARVFNVGIVNLEIATGKQLSIENCNIANATCESGSRASIHGCHIWGGDFSGLAQGVATSCMFLSLSTDINLSTSAVITNSFIFDYGSVTGKYIVPPQSAYNCYVVLGDTKVSNIVKYSNCQIDCGDVEFDSATNITNCNIDANSILCAPDVLVDFSNSRIVTEDGFTADSAVIKANNCYFTGDIYLSGDASFVARNTQQSPMDTVYISETAQLHIYDGSRFDIIDISDSGASYDWRFQLIDNSETASESIAGKMRYREDANNSYLEQVMKTGASTWAWVVVKQNTW